MTLLERLMRATGDGEQARLAWSVVRDHPPLNSMLHHVREMMRVEAAVRDGNPAAMPLYSDHRAAVVVFALELAMDIGKDQ